VALFGESPGERTIPTRIFPKGDYLFLSAGEEIKTPDALPLGNMLWLRDRLYWVRLDILKGNLTLTEFPSGLTPVNLSMTPDLLSLFEENSGRCVMVYRPAGKTLALPPGNYRLLSYKAQRRDDKGNIWHLIATGTNESRPVAVHSKQGANFPLGEPYTPFIAFPDRNGEKGIPQQIDLLLNLTGCGKELVTSLLITKEKKTGFPFFQQNTVNYPDKPFYTIVKSDGELVARGSFEYG
jgi:hypothetical protein